MLIITADDYGITGKVSKGIRDSIEFGAVTCTSVMVNFVCYKDINLLVNLKKKTKCGIGLHLNLTQGNSLITKKPFKEEEIQDLSFINCEIREQYRLFKDIFFDVDHINFHQDIHNDIKIMQEFLAMDDLKNTPVRFVNVLMKDILSINKRLIADRFVNVFPSTANSANFHFFLEKAMNDLLGNKDIITEWVVHPGYADNKLQKLAPDYCNRRELELALMCNTALLNFIRENDIIMQTFSLPVT
ncbi:MAG: ChbG/HpnK family deacetylase [Mucilaginibacter sp.]|uniref:ChbG/HpnK family deacetylase n=1 Tax=Mucilaginibacter sp. TaxID=1882438 RepID=UPI00326444BB